MTQPKRLSAERLEEICVQHVRWANDPNASRGQRQDSITIMELLSHIATLETELGKLKAERDSLQESLRQSEAERMVLNKSVENIEAIVKDGIQENGGPLAHRAAIQSWCNQALSSPAPDLSGLIGELVSALEFIAKDARGIGMTVLADKTIASTKERRERLGV